MKSHCPWIFWIKRLFKYMEAPVIFIRTLSIHTECTGFYHGVFLGLGSVQANKELRTAMAAEKANRMPIPY